MNATIKRLESLALRQGLALGVMHSSSQSDFALMLASAAQCFVRSHEYTEREINDLLRAWLAGAGAMVAVDHVELRRWLVDTGVLTRDGFGRAYTPGAPAPGITAAMDALAGHDLNALVRGARERDAERRETRKAQWAKAPGRGP
jgi:Uncharacterized protein conserved in bacteria (DUF2087)